MVVGGHSINQEARDGGLGHLNQGNQIMIVEIMKNQFTVSNFPNFRKYINDYFEIIVQNNKSIIVIDKILNRFYKDLKIAYANILTGS
jgi:hypothetical protein